MPLALSLVCNAASMAIPIKTMVRNNPITIIIIPVTENSYIQTGSPIPIKKAMDKEVDKPIKRLIQMAFLFKG